MIKLKITEASHLISSACAVCVVSFVSVSETGGPLSACNLSRCNEVSAKHQHYFPFQLKVFPWSQKAVTCTVHQHNHTTPRGENLHTQ